MPRKSFKWVEILGLNLYVDLYYNKILAQIVRIYHYFNTLCVVYNFTIHKFTIVEQKMEW